MNRNLHFDYSLSLPFVRQEEIERYQSLVSSCHQQLHQKSGQGHKYLGWLDWPLTYDKEEFERIKIEAKQIAKQADVFLVIGVGGSYLGAKAAIDLLTHTFYNQLSQTQRKAPEIYFIGHQLSPTHLSQLVEILQEKEVIVNVISKSGTTTEPAIAFRIIRQFLEKKYGPEEVKERIIVTTDKNEGALQQIATENGYKTFHIPRDIGGRYSVLTAVGLLPMAVAGIEIDQLMAGAASAYQHYQESRLEENECYQYAVLRHLLYRQGKTIELLVNYEPTFQSFAEWWKQLFGESEGKEKKGIFPASVNFTTDLHSIGQYIQDGTRQLFETVLVVERVRQDLFIPLDEENLDGLNFLAEKSMHSINQQALKASVLAHTDGGVPNFLLRLPEVNAYYFGQLVYFFEKACAMSGYLLGVNPFNQPGVEAYKKNMLALLGKPGYEQEKKRLEARLMDLNM